MAKLIHGWKELKGCTSETHLLDLDVESGHGWIHPKDDLEFNSFRDHHYLSTHTFYGSTYKYSTELLQQCGFDVELDNWDKEE